MGHDTQTGGYTHRVLPRLFWPFWICVFRHATTPRPVPGLAPHWARRGPLVFCAVGRTRAAGIASSLTEEATAAGDVEGWLHDPGHSNLAGPLTLHGGGQRGIAERQSRG